MHALQSCLSHGSARDIRVLSCSRLAGSCNCVPERYNQACRCAWTWHESMVLEHPSGNWAKV